MAFWSGERLEIELPALITPYDEKNIDCASYVLHLGDQAFVTKDELLNGKPDVVTTQTLDLLPPHHTVCIGTGQFAFLLTEETVSVSNNAIALINIKTKLKFKGLINVSGFHVDPGFMGKLVFGVYNAGTQPIFLERGQPLAMIVYADLDQTTSKVYIGGAKKRQNIEVGLIEDMTGQVFSPMALQREMKAMAGDLTHLRTRGGILDGMYYTIIGIFVSIILAFMTLDYPKIMFGGMVKSSMDLYTYTIQKEVKDLSDSKQSSCPEIPCNSPTSTTK